MRSPRSVRRAVIPVPANIVTAVTGLCDPFSEHSYVYTEQRTRATSAASARASTERAGFPDVSIRYTLCEHATTTQQSHEEEHDGGDQQHMDECADGVDPDQSDHAISRITAMVYSIAFSLFHNASSSHIR